MNWKAFFQGLLAATIGGAVTTVAQTISDPSHFDVSHIGPVAGAGAILGASAYLAPSPLKQQPPVQPPETPTKFPTTK